MVGDFTMYKYNPCAPGIANNKRLFGPYVKPVVGQGSANTESSRMIAEQCTNIVVNHVPLTIAPSTAPPFVPVQTTPASVTTAALSQAVILKETNPYVPATRFSRYFPAPPLEYMPPSMFRVPNNYPLPSTRCPPTFRLYQSTAESLKNSQP